MKNIKHVSLFLVACLGMLLFVNIASAQAASVPAVLGVSAPAAESPQAAAILNYLVPFFVPLVVMVFKKVAPNIPSFLLPIIAAGVGVALEYVNHFATGQPASVAYGVAFGLAGVGLREIGDQLKKTVTQAA